MANGIWGTIAVGLFANPDAPAGLNGLFYTGSFKQLGLQCLGVLSVGVYATIMMIMTFAVIKKLHGIRTSAEDEIAGLDITEHGLPSAYPDFAPAVNKYSSYAPADGITAVSADTPIAEAVPVKKVPSFSDDDAIRPKFTKIEIICKEPDINTNILTPIFPPILINCIHRLLTVIISVEKLNPP